MAHGSSRLTPHGRRLVVERVLTERWRPALVAEAAGISRATVYKWLRRYRAAGADGLVDRSSRPRRSPRQVPEVEERRILKLRRGMRRGPNRLAPMVNRPASTVYAVLRRHGVSRLRDFDRVSHQPIRYVRERAGELVHLDVKKLGRIPARGGHASLAKPSPTIALTASVTTLCMSPWTTPAGSLSSPSIQTRRTRSACAFVRQLVGFYASVGVQVERLMTDQHPSYRLSRAFARQVADLGIRHKMTRRYRPQTNGKAERFIQTLLDEWAYSRLYRSNPERLLALPRWVNFYNRRRPHSELGDRPPIAAVVNNVLGDYT